MANGNVKSFEPSTALKIALRGAAGRLSTAILEGRYKEAEHLTEHLFRKLMQINDADALKSKVLDELQSGGIEVFGHYTEGFDEEHDNELFLAWVNAKSEHLVQFTYYEDLHTTTAVWIAADRKLTEEEARAYVESLPGRVAE